MKIFCNGYTGRAWLLSDTGKEIRVLNHPSDTFEFDSVVDVVLNYGSNYEKSIAEKYVKNPSDALKHQVLDIYNNRWCKVRAWGAFNEEVYFRITSQHFNWYSIIVGFLVNHPEFENSIVTVEADRSSGTKKIYLTGQSYQYVIAPENETVLASHFRYG